MSGKHTSRLSHYVRTSVWKCLYSHFLQREMDLDLLAAFKGELLHLFFVLVSFFSVIFFILLNNFPYKRVSAGRPVERYSVEFPLARPSSENIQAICLHGNRRPRYPESYFPSSGYGVNKRQADAVNTLEAWFGNCCRNNQTEEVTLCCAKQAWETSLDHFCEVGFTIKAPHFHCCKITGNERLSCFDNSAKNPSYNPTEEEPVQPVPPEAEFSFDPQSCPGTAVIPHYIRGKSRPPTTSLKVDLTFPPAPPMLSNIDSLCRNQRLRPLYNIKCLAGLGYDLVARQAKTSNRLEKAFKRCCKSKQTALPCAQKWEEQMKKFCVGSKGKTIDFLCCDAEALPLCFRNISTDPEYTKTVLTESLSLDNLCGTHKVITKNLTALFCHFNKAYIFIFYQLKEEFEAMCSSTKAAPPSVRRCCRDSSEQCFNGILMEAITKATGISLQKKKICPVS
uniref:Extracellular matrix protein 1b n=1 Tax=Neogobius melanostomus TaxID=47308 RepID=A0A8C6TWF4_9GOBI